MSETATDQQRRSWQAPVALGVILVAAAVLRLVTLAQTPLWWDEGNNAYFAHASLGELLRMSRATMDTDPPVHRLVLKAWLWLWGDGSFQLRALSALCGVLGVWLTYAWGNWLYERKVGLAAAALAAIWPAFVYHSREGKPYALIVLLTGLAVYLWQRYLDQAPRLRLLPWLGAVLCAALALGAHYYVALFMAAQGLGLAVMLAVSRSSWREVWRRLWRWLSIQLAAVMLVLPWAALTYETALRGAANLPEVSAQASLAAYGRKVALGLVAGPGVSAALAPAVMVAGAVLVLLALFAAVKGGRCRPATWHLLTAALAPLALGFAAQQVVPFVQARFFLYIIPPLAISAAAGLVRLGKRGWPVAVGLALVLGLALSSALRALDGPPEDLRPVAQALEAQALPGDGVVVGYIWQQGILELVAPDLPVRYHLGWYNDDSVQAELTTLLQSHRRLWLLSYRAGPQQPGNTPGWWLEQHTARAYLLEAPPYVLTLYTDPQPEGSVAAVGDWAAATEFAASFEGGVALVEASVPEKAKAGDALSLALTWGVTAADAPQWIVFVHLVDGAGKLWAQSDGPPQNGLRSFAGCATPTTILSERAMLIPREAPPGEYRILLGLYDGATGQRSPVLSGPAAGADHVVIAQVQVESPE